MQTKGNILTKIKQQSNKFVTFTVLTLLSAIFGLAVFSSPASAQSQSACVLQASIGGTTSLEKTVLKKGETSKISFLAGAIPQACTTSDLSLSVVFSALNLVPTGNSGNLQSKTLPPKDIPIVLSQNNNGLQKLTAEYVIDATKFLSEIGFAEPTGNTKYSVDVEVFLTNKSDSKQSSFSQKKVFEIVPSSSSQTDPICLNPQGGTKVLFKKEQVYIDENVGLYATYDLPSSLSDKCGKLSGGNRVIFDFILSSESAGQKKEITFSIPVANKGSGSSFSGYEANKELLMTSSGVNFPDAKDGYTATLKVKVRYDLESKEFARDIGGSDTLKVINEKANGRSNPEDKDYKDVGTKDDTGRKETDTGTITGTIVGLIADIIAAIIAFIRLIIYYLLAYIIVPILTGILSIQTYKDSFAEVILPGWNIIRNIGNIFFVVVLIVIGLTTLFRIEGYQYKDLLVKLVIAAVLVNFSLVIGQAVLAIAETVQFQFLPPESSTVEALVKKLVIDPESDKGQITFDQRNLDASGGMAKLINPFFKLALAVGSAIVLGGIAVFLVIRMVALWILLMLSPIPYIADILPATRSYKKQWWSYFLRYAFFTPIMAFFLNLTAYIAVEHDNYFKNAIQKNSLKDTSGVAEFFFLAASNIIILVFLIAAIKVANAFGIEGANTFTNIANKGIKLPFKLGAGAAAGAGGLAASYAQQKKQEITSDLAERGRLGRLAFTLANPVTSTKAGISRLKERQQAVESRAKATAYDTVQKLPGGSLLGDKSRQVQSNTTKDVKQYSERNPYVNSEITKNDLKETFTSGSKDYNARLRVEAKLTQLAEDKELGATLTNAKKDLGLDNNYDSSTAGFAAFMNDLVKKGYVTKDRAAYLAEDLGKIAKKNKENYYDGATTVDQNTGELKLIDAEVRDVGGEKQAVINGEEIYNTTNQTIIEKQEKAVEDLGPGADSAKKAEVIDKIKKEEVDKLSDTDRASYKNYESYVKSIDAQKTAAQKTSPDSIAKDANAGQFVATDASSGKKKLNDVGADFVAKANDRHYAQSDNVGYGLKQGFISALTDNKDESVKLVAKALQDRALKEDGVKIPDQKATELAQKKIAEFGDKFLQYNLDSKTPLFKQQKAVIDNVLIKEAEFKDALYTGVSKGSDRSDVKSYINEMVSNPSSYKYDLPSQLSNKFIDKNAESKVQERVKKYMGDMYADRFKPKDLGLSSLDQSEVDSIREAIRKGFSETVDSNKGRSISDDAVRDMLKNTIKAKVQASSSTAEVKLKSAEIAEKLIADIKPISVNNPSTQPPPVNPPSAGQNVP